LPGKGLWKIGPGRFWEFVKPYWVSTKQDAAAISIAIARYVILFFLRWSAFCCSMPPFYGGLLYCAAFIPQWWHQLPTAKGSGLYWRPESHRSYGCRC